jgi:hemoglobin/transferrin/lactoferrin receptor protein
MKVNGSVLARYSSANNENTGHADINAGFKKWAFLSSLSRSNFGDLKMGRYGGQDAYLRQEYINRTGGKDSIVRNSDPRVQRFSGYNQLNFLQKVRFRPTKNVDLQYSFSYAGTGDAPRYDRLIQYRDGALRFAEWNYGPMLWRMHTIQATLSRKSVLYDDARVIASYQDYAESRLERTRTAMPSTCNRKKCTW